MRDFLIEQGVEFEQDLNHLGVSHETYLNARPSWFLTTTAKISSLEIAHLKKVGDLFFYSNERSSKQDRSEMSYSGISLQISSQSNSTGHLLEDNAIVCLNSSTIEITTSEKNKDLIFYAIFDDQLFISNDYLVISYALESSVSNNTVGIVEMIDFIRPYSIQSFSLLDLTTTVKPRNNNALLYNFREPVDLSSISNNGSQTEAVRHIDLLCKSIESSLNGANRVGVVLSGGIDSGIVAYLCRKELGLETVAYTMGTAHGNEVSEAFELCQLIDIKHVPIFVPDKSLLASVPKAISYLGCSDLSVVDISLSFFAMLESGKLNENILLTGYGNDLLNGGLLTSIKNKNNVLSGLQAQLISTSKTNELSTRFALEENVTLIHPYFDSSVVAHSVKVPLEYKFSNGREKAYIRKWFSQKTTGNIAWRKKIAVHHGSAINVAILNALNMSSNKGNDPQSIYRKIHEAVVSQRFYLNVGVDEIIQQIESLFTGKQRYE